MQIKTTRQIIDENYYTKSVNDEIQRSIKWVKVEDVKSIIKDLIENIEQTEFQITDTKYTNLTYVDGVISIINHKFKELK